MRMRSLIFLVFIAMTLLIVGCANNSHSDKNLENENLENNNSEKENLLDRDPFH